MANEQATLQRYVASPEQQQQLYKRTLIIIVVSQIFGGLGLAAGVTVGALLAEQMLGTSSLAGVPTALFTLGSAGAALLIGHLSHRFGRRPGLAAGFLAGGVGAVGVVIAALQHNVPLLFASLFIYGAGTATNLQARYAGTDLATAKQRGTAISIAMVSTTLGAVAGPNLVDVTGRLATSIGIPALAGPFILAAAAYIGAGIVLLVLLRPDPLRVAQAVAQDAAQKAGRATDGPAEAKLLNKPAFIVGVTAMLLSQLVMVAIMTMTPVHMGHHGHNLRAVGLVIGLHIAAMYLPSPLTGMLVDKIGRSAMVVVSGTTLLLAGVIAALAPGGSMLLLTTALVLLGLGWNFGLITGTALIIDATSPTNRAKMQGSVDVFIALAGAAGGVLSGVVVAHFSYVVLSLAGGMVSLLLIPALFWSGNINRREPAPSSR